MNEENKGTELATTGEDLPPEEEATIEEEFRGLYSDINKIKDRWLRLAKTKEEEKDTSAAQVIRLIAGDIIPIITDLIAASGGALEEVTDYISDQEETSEGGNITDEEVTQIYVTLLSNVQAFTRLHEGATDEPSKAALTTLIGLNETTMTMIKDNFGEEVATAAAEQVKEAAAG